METDQASWWEQDKKRWTVCDAVMKKALAVLMGAAIVQFLHQFKPKDMSHLRWNGLQCACALPVCPTIGLFLHNYGTKGLTDVRSSQRALISMTAAQVLAWANKFFFASLLRVIPGDGTFATCAVALALYLVYIGANALKSAFKLPGFKDYSNHPFTRFRQNKQLVASYYDFILGTLPLSVGFAVNGVCVLGRDYLLSALDHAVMHYQKEDRNADSYRSLHMFVYASYFVWISALSVLIAVHKPSDILVLLGLREKPEESEEATALAPEGGAQYDVDEDGATMHIKQLERRVAIIEGTLGQEPDPDDESGLAAEKTLEMASQVIKHAQKARDTTIKFVFAWSVTGFLETFFFQFLMECYTPIPTCGPGPAFLQAIALSFIIFQYVWTIATVDDENNKYVDKLFELQKAAAPLNVGFAWNRFMGAWSSQIGRELPEFTRTATGMVVVIFYIFLSFGYHIYRVMSADLKLKPLPRVA